VRRRRDPAGGAAGAASSPAPGSREPVVTEQGITIYPARCEGDRWRAVWYEPDGSRGPCQSVSEHGLAAKLEKVTERLAPATTLTVRACCLILHNGQIALIHRQRPSGGQYSIPGGIVHADEQVKAALARELEEEPGLDVTALPREPGLRWVQDQVTTRPGSTTPFRRLHLIHVLPDLPATARNAMPATARNAMPATEQDTDDDTRITWLPLGQAAGLHQYPAVGAAIQTLTGARGQPTPVLLPPITDQTFRWR
jgi:ADP-ribose pyrophosphatase YjhB (NUDIX family)